MPVNRGALCGLLVLDLSRLLPGPYCTMILADHGARVIAIEDRRFKDADVFPATVNRNKEHMTLNLKTEEGRGIFYRLAAAADVIVEGFRPGVVQRLGVDYETIRKINPRIVYCALTGYGQTGRLKDRAGHDVNYLAQAGVLDLIGAADRPPSIPGVQMADIAGGLNAAVGILLALLARGQSGRGQYIDVSLTDAAAGLLSLQLHFLQTTGRA
ncbi:MAG: CaiB/BaiF CoA-transferase family protein, partial [Desulfobacterales bacterium]